MYRLRAFSTSFVNWNCRNSRSTSTIIPKLTFTCATSTCIYIYLLLGHENNIWPHSLSQARPFHINVYMCWCLIILLRYDCTCTHAHMRTYTHAHALTLFYAFADTTIHTHTCNTCTHAHTRTWRHALSFTHSQIRLHTAAERVYAQAANARPQQHGRRGQGWRHQRTAASRVR